MNANGDERIDHDEFVKFMLKMLMGTLQQKMYIAFRCYDVDDDQTIADEEVKIVLSNIPLRVEERYGTSFSSKLSMNDYVVEKNKDVEDIDSFIAALFDKETF